MPIVGWTASARIISEINLTQYVNRTVIIKSTGDSFPFTSIIRTIIQTLVLVRMNKETSALTKVKVRSILHTCSQTLGCCYQPSWFQCICEIKHHSLTSSKKPTLLQLCTMLLAHNYAIWCAICWFILYRPEQRLSVQPTLQMVKAETSSDNMPLKLVKGAKLFDCWLDAFTLPDWSNACLLSPPHFLVLMGLRQIHFSNEGLTVTARELLLLQIKYIMESIASRLLKIKKKQNNQTTNKPKTTPTTFW